MRRLATLATVVASLAAAPAASAATFTVNDSGDAPDQTPTAMNGQCRTASNTCTLRAAIQQANATPEPDTIEFADPLGAATIRPATPLPTITAPLTIDGGGDITIAPGDTFPATFPLLVVNAPSSSVPSSTLRLLTLEGDPAGPGRAGPLVRVGASDVLIDRVVARNSADDGIELAAAAQRVRFTRSPIYAPAAGREPIALEPGANGGIGPPSLRIGPRRGDGLLPVTGSAPDGVVELFRGDPAIGPITFAADSPGGNFTFLPTPEPAPGEKLSATATDTSGNTSPFAVATTPSDVVSPALLGGVATSLSDVRIQPSEPLDPATVQVDDFTLVMAGTERPLGGATVAPDGSSVTLHSATPWLNGEAGIVTLRGAAGVADPAGNQNLLPAPVRVGGAPGDFIAPAVTSLKVNPKSRICISKGPRCPRPGTYVSFVSSEDGEAVFTFVRGRRTLGTRRYAIEPGRNRIRFDGRIRGRKMTAGRYKLYVGVEDAVGNISSLQPRYLFSIRSTSRRR